MGVSVCVCVLHVCFSINEIQCCCISLRLFYFYRYFSFLYFCLHQNQSVIIFGFFYAIFFKFRVCFIDSIPIFMENGLTEWSVLFMIQTMWSKSKIKLFHCDFTNQSWNEKIQYFFLDIFNYLNFILR